MKYKFKVANNYFIKNDSEKVFTILLNSSGLQFHVNQVGKCIFELLQQYDNTDDLLNALYKLFPKINTAIIKSDFDDIFDLMILYGVISVNEEKEKLVYTDAPIVKFAGDGGYKQLLDFFNAQDKHNKMSIYCYKNMKNINPVSLRYSTFHNYEYFCSAYDENNQILLSVAMQPPQDSLSVVVLNGIVFSKELNNEEIINIFNKVLNLISQRIEKVTKFRFNLLGNSQAFQNNEFIKIIQNLGFKKEASLEKESGYETMHMFTKKLI